jgi:hypothetical protein
VPAGPEHRRQRAGLAERRRGCCGSSLVALSAVAPLGCRAGCDARIFTAGIAGRSRAAGRWRDRGRRANARQLVRCMTAPGDERGLGGGGARCDTQGWRRAAAGDSGGAMTSVARGDRGRERERRDGGANGAEAPPREVGNPCLRRRPERSAAVRCHTADTTCLTHGEATHGHDAGTRARAAGDGDRSRSAGRPTTTIPQPSRRAQERQRTPWKPTAPFVLPLDWTIPLRDWSKRPEGRLPVSQNEGGPAWIRWIVTPARPI